MMLKIVCIKIVGCSLILLTLAGCSSMGVNADGSTRYQSAGFSGGYKSEDLGDGRYRVWFLHSAYSGQEYVRKCLMYRCAELTEEQGKRYFIVESKKKKLIPMKLEYVITMLDIKPPDEVESFDAAKVKAELHSEVIGK